MTRVDKTWGYAEADGKQLGSCCTTLAYSRERGYFLKAAFARYQPCRGRGVPSGGPPSGLQRRPDQHGAGFPPKSGSMTPVSTRRAWSPARILRRRPARKTGTGSRPRLCSASV